MIIFTHSQARRLILLLVASCYFVTAHAVERNWYPGAIALTDGKIMRGLIAYDHVNDLVQFEREEEKFTFSARQVLEFRYFDETEKMHHKFRSYQYPNRYGYLVIEFFEVIFLGEINMLRKRKRFSQKTSDDDLPTTLSSHQRTHLLPHLLDYNYFFFYNNQISTLHKFRREMLPAIAQNHPILSEMLMDDDLLRSIKRRDKLVVFVRKVNRMLTQMSDDRQYSLYNKVGDTQ